MIYLFGSTGVAQLARFCRKKALYAFDFDGTLAPMAIDPEQAGMRDSTERLWNELSQEVEVAVITGRSRKDAATKFKKRVHHLVGNHGLEGEGKRRWRLAKAKQTVRDWKTPLLERVKNLSGVEVENKVFSISVHYRRARSRGRAKSAIFELASRLSPVPRIIPGKCVVNLVPPGSPNKGTALLEVMNRTGFTQALFVGDDHTDEDVFRIRRKGLFTIRVGKRGESGAKYFIKGQSEIDRLLRTLLVSSQGSER